MTNVRRSLAATAFVLLGTASLRLFSDRLPSGQILTAATSAWPCWMRPSAVRFWS